MTFWEWEGMKNSGGWVAVHCLVTACWQTADQLPSTHSKGTSTRIYRESIVGFISRKWHFCPPYLTERKIKFIIWNVLMYCTFTCNLMCQQFYFSSYVLQLRTCIYLFTKWQIVIQNLMLNLPNQHPTPSLWKSNVEPLKQLQLHTTYLLLHGLPHAVLLDGWLAGLLLLACSACLAHCWGPHNLIQGQPLKFSVILILKIACNLI